MLQNRISGLPVLDMRTGSIGVDANDFRRHYVFDSHGHVPRLEFARR